MTFDFIVWPYSGACTGTGANARAAMLAADEAA